MPGESHIRQVLVIAFPQSVPGRVWRYARRVGRLLGVGVSRVTTAGEFERQSRAAGGPVLAILSTRDHPVLDRLLPGLADHGLVAGQTGDLWAMLVVQRPCWPPDRILLVLGGGEADQAAVDWAVHLAQAGEGAVTVLALVPPQPGMDRWRGCVDRGLPALLTADTALGQQRQRIAHHLRDRGIGGTLRLRQGPPDQQIYQEVITGSYDLIVLAATPCPQWHRWFQADWPGPPIVVGLTRQCEAGWFKDQQKLVDTFHTGRIL